jgi:hypothetical protein
MALILYTLDIYDNLFYFRSSVLVQKNQTHARQLLDQERLEHPEMLDDLNELLKRWDQWRNFFFGRGSGLVGQKDGV